MIKIGNKAPDFSAKDQLGKTIKLSDLEGNNIIIYFYPKDDTPGCTIEACEFRDAFPLFEKSRATVIGISADDERSHKRFTDKYSLPFQLLVDADKSISKRYGVWKKKSFMGRKYLGIERTTFIINRKGKVVHIFNKVNPKGHAKEVNEIIKKLK
jgi:thioredoxin-dependent peroxiredoxin